VSGTLNFMFNSEVAASAVTLTGRVVAGSDQGDLSVMADDYLLENGTDRLLLEDGSGSETATATSIEVGSSLVVIRTA